MAQSNAFTYLAPSLQVLGTNGAVIAGGEGADSTKGTPFRPTLFGAAITNTFSITNVGNAMLTISGYTNTGADAAQYLAGAVVTSNQTVTSSPIAPKKPGSPSGLRLRPVQVFR